MPTITVVLTFLAEIPEGIDPKSLKAVNNDGQIEIGSCELSEKRGESKFKRVIASDEIDNITTDILDENGEDTFGNDDEDEDLEETNQS